MCFTAGQLPQQQGQGLPSQGRPTATAQDDETGPHLATITKQINTVNEDGSYTVGYQSSDGQFRLETRLPNGDTEGAYGYIDAKGELITIRYKAGNGTGFSAVGPGIDEHAGQPPSIGAFEDPLAQAPAPGAGRPTAGRPVGPAGGPPPNFVDIPRGTPAPQRQQPRPSFPQFRPQEQPAFQPRPQVPAQRRPQPSFQPRPAFQGNSNGISLLNSQPSPTFNALSNQILGEDFVPLGGPAQFVGINPAFQRPPQIQQVQRPAFPQQTFRPGTPQQNFRPGPPQQNFRAGPETPIFRSSAPQFAPNQPTPSQLFRIQQQQDQISARNRQPSFPAGRLF